jgi:hypothetical protein
MRERRRHKVTGFYYDKRTSNRDMKKYDEMKEEGREGRSVKSSKNIMSNEMKTGKDAKQYNFVDDRKEEGFVVA